MSTKLTLNKLLTALIVLTLMSGCNSTPTPSQPTATSTIVSLPTQAAVVPTLDQNQLNTQPAQTAAPTNTLSLPTDTQFVPTNTFTPSVTFTPTSAPTSTPLSVSPTITLIPWTLTPGATSTGYNCAVTSTSPKSTDTIKISTSFNWSWGITNTGSKLWGKHNADIKYISGTIMQTKGNIYNLTADVLPGSSYTATIAMQSPATAGTYTAAWEIVQDGVLVCSLSLSVKVVN